jgi:hypothetical protein
MSTQDNLTIAQGIYTAFGQGDIPAILNVFADDVELHEPPGGEPPFTGVYRGRDGAGRFFQEMVGAVDVLMLEPQNLSLRVTPWWRWGTIASAQRQPA